MPQRSLFDIIATFYIICTVMSMYFTENEETTVTMLGKNCRPRYRLISSKKGDSFLIVDAVIKETLELECHFCNEDDDILAKIWYKTEYPNESQPFEVNLDMTTNLTKRNIFINSKHSLIIRNVNYEHRGIYFCQSQDALKAENKFKYLVDIVFGNATLPEFGNLSQWNKYQHEYLHPVNQRFLSSNEEDFSHIRDELNIHLEVLTEWNPWSKCQICGRPLGAGQKRRVGSCRIKSSPFNQNKSFIINTTNEEELFFLNIFELSCHSIMFTNLYPAIGKITKIIPNFIQVEKCSGICNPDADKVNSLWKSSKSVGYKYRTTYVLAEKAHLTLICPESTLENSVIWRFNGKILKAGKSVIPNDPNAEPIITVDTFNTLYLIGVTLEESGNYTCQVDSVKMQQIILYVTSKSKLLTQAFVRYMMYLAFILSLTLSCYCAGLIIVCKKRHSFKSYEQLAQDDD